ncbi:MAG: hypothetical protein NTX14_01990 [Candidatus Nealsonbacteria bacterium]|nr:hypothetical protein [Candidatus Nealsonbacteria bacterium]
MNSNDKSDIGIVEGMSSYGSIRFQARDYFSVARLNKKTGRIECVVKRFWWPARFYNAHPYFPLSRFVRSMTRMIVLLSGKSVAVIVVMLLVVSAIMLQAMLVSPGNEMAVSRTMETGVELLYAPMVLSILIGLKRQAGWHGAMNMALAAYNEGGKTDLLSIAKEDYIYSKASDRFYVPLSAAGVLSSGLAAVLSANRDLTYMAVAEAFLWVDLVKGFGAVPFAKQASRLFQKWISAKPPEGVQLLVAQRAMKGLIEAQQES